MTLSPPLGDRSNNWETTPTIAADSPTAVTGVKGALLSLIATGALMDAMLLAVALGGGAFLRVWQINAVGVNSDEAVYAGQAAAISGQPVLSQFFPIFRAHPMLFQFVLALILPFGGLNRIDLTGRLLSASVGIATIMLVFLCGRRLYGQRVGAVAALFIALMPYHVVVTRQILLDGPMAFCATLTLYCLIRFASSRNPGWFYASGACMGLTVMAKETSIILVAGIYVFLALTPELRVRIRDLIVSLGFMAAVVVPFPLALKFAGGGGSQRAQQYLVWQLFRPPNHSFSFYPTTVPSAIGPLIVAAALIGFVLLRHHFSWRERLLVAWIIMPCLFFQSWPVKGFQYLLPIASPIAILAARTVVLWRPQDAIRRVRLRAITGHLNLALVAVLAISIGMPAWQRIQVRTSDQFMAGSGGVPGGRETGAWIDRNTPVGSTVMSIGPSMANIIEFYGHRQAYGLSVSTNPLHRNPSYEPIRNPDFELRTRKHPVHRLGCVFGSALVLLL